MTAGAQLTFVIPWAQTETDGTRGAGLNLLSVGVTWRWSGTPVRIGGPQGVLVLARAEGMADLHRRAARMVRRLIGAGTAPTGEKVEPDLPDQCFVVTDGRDSFVITVLTVPDTAAMLAMVVGALPPVDRDLWVVAMAIDHSRTVPQQHGKDGMICFTPGTWLATPDGPRLIEDLRQGDRVLTRDNGAQIVLWRGQKRLTGARLHAMPHLRPIRLRRGALGLDRPEQDLLVSPQHRMLVKGASAQALFNVDEVLVTAQDLINDHSITVDHALREVTYVHILLPRHNIIWANGLETESFHPAHAAFDLIQPDQRQNLLDLMPDLAESPQSYGDPARRNLTKSEAAILRHDMRL
ncbi:MAG: Hint domain-containing protein [Candidatus Saccharibacteria bacterium]|nr:Hint domain-containing protein [Pseudorhodobacter sp.]